jgi:hypothetical protein
MTPEEEQALFMEMRRYMAGRNTSNTPMSFIYGTPIRTPGASTERGRGVPYPSLALFNQALPHPGALMASPAAPVSAEPMAPGSAASQPSSGLLGGVGRLSRFNLFNNPGYNANNNPNNR